MKCDVCLKPLGDTYALLAFFTLYYWTFEKLLERHTK